MAACLREHNPSIHALTLALDCENEALKVQPHVRKKLEHILVQGIEDSDPERRKLVAEALLTLRLKRMKRVEQNLYIDHSLITHAEYQLFLDEQRSRGQHLQPDHWPQHQFALGSGRKAVLGVRPSDAEAFCQWLTERDLQGWVYRVPYNGESEPIGGTDKLSMAADMIHQLLEREKSTSAGYWTRSKTGSEYILEGKPAVELPVTALEKRLRRDCNRPNDRTRARTLDHNLDLDFERAFDRELAQELRNNRDLALALTVELARGEKLADIRTLALNLSQTLTHALDHTLEVERNLTRDIARVLDIERALAHAHALDHTLDLDLVLKQQLARHNELHRAHNLTRNLNNIRARAVNRVLSRTLARTRRDALERARDETRSRDFGDEFNLHRAVERARGLDLKVDNRTRIDAVQRARTLDRALNLDQAVTELRRVAHKAIGTEDSEFLRWYARFIVWLITESLLTMLRQQERPRSFMDLFFRREKDQYWEEDVQDLADKYFDLYIDLAILEERLEGNLPAFEGIRIIKERKAEA